MSRTSIEPAGIAPPAGLSSLEALHAASDAAAVRSKVIPVPELRGLSVELWGLSAPDRQEMWATCYVKATASADSPATGASGDDAASEAHGEAGPAEDDDAPSIPVYDKLYPFLLTRCVRDPVSKALIYQGRLADPAYINSREPALLDRFINGIFELSGIGKSAVEKEKNGSATTESGGTSSGSPAS